MNASHLQWMEIARFIAVGLLNTLVGYSLYALFLYCNLSYPLALLLATILGVLFNFQSIGRLVFKTYRNNLIWKFIGVYVVTFCINLLLIKVMTQLGLNAYYAGALALLPCTVISYLLNKFFVFKE
jgi:putative flippase GtrA